MVARKSCFGCITLRTGCFVIGVFDILVSAGYIFASGNLIRLLLIASSVLLLMGAWLQELHWMWPWLILTVLTVILAGMGLIAIVFKPDIVVDVIKDQLGLRLEGKSIAIPAGFLAIMFTIGAFEIYIVHYFIRVLHQKEKSRRFKFGHSTGSDRNQITLAEQ